MLSGLQSQHVRTFFVHIGQGQFVCAFFQYVNQVFRKVFTGLNDRVVVTEVASHRTQLGNSPLNLGNSRVNVAVQIPTAFGNGFQTQTFGRSVHTLNLNGGRTIFVKDDFQIVFLQQVNTFVAGIFGQRVDLSQNFIELFNIFVAFGNSFFVSNFSVNNTAERRTKQVFGTAADRNMNLIAVCNGITGSFTDGENPVSEPVSLPENGSSTVYLILAGKPEQELKNATIGSVTVTIGGESE